MCKTPLQRKDGKPIDWERAKGFSKYLVSTEGQVYSLERDVIIPLDYNTSGYRRAYIYNDEGKQKHALVHKLVYLAHVGPIPEGLVINHKDEDKSNNQVENLELLTQSQNVRYGTGIERRIKSLKRNKRIRRIANAM